jgi:hypothetical protein
VPEVRDGIEDERDVEAGPKLEKTRTSKSRRSTRDPNLVTWDGPQDTNNPKNWTVSRKWAATLVGEHLSFSAKKQKLMIGSLVLHFHLSCFLVYGCACSYSYCTGI